jgi:hypothetical protein
MIGKFPLATSMLLGMIAFGEVSADQVLEFEHRQLSEATPQENSRKVLRGHDGNEERGDLSGRGKTDEFAALFDWNDD